jgi:hypothetical protein
MDSQDLINQLAEDMQPVKPAPHPLRMSVKWALVAAAYIAIFVYVFGARPDIADQLSSPLFAGEIVLLAATLLACMWSTALLAYPDSYQKDRPLAAPIVSFTLLICMLYAQWLYADLHIAIPMHGLICTIHITILALPPATLLFYSLSRMASTHYIQAGAVALLTAFSIGGLIARLTEMTDSIQHIVVWHYLPMLAAAAIGTLLGRLLLKW